MESRDMLDIKHLLVESFSRFVFLTSRRCQEHKNMSRTQKRTGHEDVLWCQRVLRGTAKILAKVAAEP